MAWIDSTYLQNMIGSSQVTALGLTGDVLTQYEASARATVLAVLQFAGYASPGDSLTAGQVSTAFLQKLTAAILLRDAYGMRKGIRLSSEAADLISQGVGMLDAVYAKKLPVPGMEPVAQNGYGGVRFSPSSSSSTNGRVSQFARDKLTSF